MKVQFFTPLNYANKNNYKYMPSSKMNFSNVTDSVCFGANKSYIEKSLEDLEIEFNKKVRPIMQDSKELYLATCKIGYDSQETVKEFTEGNSALLHKQLELTSQYGNPKLSQHIIALNSRVDKLDSNKNVFENVKKMSQREMYKNDVKLKSLIGDSLNLFEDTVESLKLKKYQQFQNQTFDTIKESFNSYSFANINPKVHANIMKLAAIKDEALYYVFMNPFSDCQKIEKGIDDIKKYPKAELYKTLKQIEHLHNSIQYIDRNYDNFNKNKPEIQKFVNQNKKLESLIPKAGELAGLFKFIDEKIEQSANSSVDKLEEYYKNEFLHPNNEVDFVKFDERLKKQSKVIKDLYEVIDNIKTNFYSSSYEQYKANN